MLWCAQPAVDAPPRPHRFDRAAHYRVILRETLPTLSTAAAVTAALCAGPATSLVAAPAYFYVQRCLIRNVLVRSRNHHNAHVKLLDGKNAVVTGASSGIGAQLAIRLALQGAHVTCITRSNPREEFEEVLLRPWLGGDPMQRNMLMSRLRFVHGDLSSLDSVRRVAAQINASEWADPQFNGGRGGLHLLINCAGIWLPKATRSDETQLESHTLVNAIAPLLLTELLAPTVARARDDAGFAGGRIINLSSMAHVAVTSPAHCRRLMSFAGADGKASSQGDPTGTEMYAFSKLLNIWHADSLARRRLCALSVSPGMTATSMYRHVYPSVANVLYWPLVSTLMKTPAEGSELAFACALRDDVEPGGYYHDGRLCNAGRSQVACDAALGEEVVRWAAAVAGLQDPEDMALLEQLPPHKRLYRATTTAAAPPRPTVIMTTRHTS